MILFGWLVAFSLLLVLVVLVLSIPGALRSARGRGSVPFTWPRLALALGLTAVLAALVIAAVLLTGAGV